MIINNSSTTNSSNNSSTIAPTNDSSLTPTSKRPRRYQRFIRGPLPEDWFKKASSISKTAAVLGIILWQKAYEEKAWGWEGQAMRSRPVKLTSQHCAKWGVCNRSMATALDLMDETGLILLDKHVGRSPLIRIIDNEVI